MNNYQGVEVSFDCSLCTSGGDCRDRGMDRDGEGLATHCSEYYPGVEEYLEGAEEAMEKHMTAAENRTTLHEVIQAQRKEILQLRAINTHDKNIIQVLSDHHGQEGGKHALYKMLCTDNR